MGESNEYYVESSTNLCDPGAWSIPTNTVLADGTNFYMMENMAPDTRFYRLQGWEILFDGTSGSAFRRYQGTSFPNAWAVTNGELQTVPGSGGNPPSIVTTNTYSDFELSWEWKVTTGGASGVDYRCTEEYVSPQFSGPQFQLTYAADVLTPGNMRMGAVWNLIAPTNRVALPVGQWNHCRLVVQNNYFEHWLNSNRVVAYQLNNSPFTNMVSTNATFNQYPEFGKAQSGYVAFRHENAATSFRNIKIRRLP